MEWTEIIGHPATWILAAVAVGAALANHWKWVGAVNEDRKTLKEQMQGVAADFKKLTREVYLGLPAGTAGSASPRCLTEVGKKVSDALDAPAIAAELAAAGGLEAKAAGLSRYGIQEMAYDAVYDYEPPADLDARIEDVAFDHGLRRREVMVVLAIELRDRLLPKPDGSAVR